MDSNVLKKNATTSEELRKDRNSSEVFPASEAASLTQENTKVDIRAIYLNYATFVWKNLQKLGVRTSDLDDALQHVFLVVHQKSNSYIHQGSLGSWLYVICIHVASSFRKKAFLKHELLVLPEAIPETVETQTPEDTLKRKQDAECLLRILDELDEEKRIVFMLYELEEKSTKEIAEILQIPRGTVHSRLHQARKDFETIACKMHENPLPQKERKEIT